jgi:hypothetical protein
MKKILYRIGTYLKKECCPHKILKSVVYNEDDEENNFLCVECRKAISFQIVTDSEEIKFDINL